MTEPQAECLRRVAGLMIPPDDALGLPGADDPVIVTEVVRTLGRDRAAVIHILAEVRPALYGDDGRMRAADDQATALAQTRRRSPKGFSALEAAVCRAYYRDPRVLAALGLEARAPFPKGHEVEAGDWSLLEPVRRRGQMYRDA